MAENRTDKSFDIILSHLKTFCDEIGIFLVFLTHSWEILLIMENIHNENYAQNFIFWIFLLLN